MWEHECPVKGIKGNSDLSQIIWKKSIETNLEKENPNKPPKEDGMTDTPLQNGKRFENKSG